MAQTAANCLVIDSSDINTDQSPQNDLYRYVTICSVLDYIDRCLFLTICCRRRFDFQYLKKMGPNTKKHRKKIQSAQPRRGHIWKKNLRDGKSVQFDFDNRQRDEKKTHTQQIHSIDLFLFL